MSALTAFLVEDNAIIRENLIGALQEMSPFEVVGYAEDERAAIAWLADHSNRCDLLIIDIFLKTGSGLGVLRAAQNLGTAKTKIVLTNYATSDVREGCERLGADRVFDKSNQIDELFAYCAELAA